jgi:prepilin-type N-terminal cleavage/methylation domain-containing protein
MAHERRWEGSDSLRSSKSKMKNNPPKGFSLIELLIVVAIIGIIAAIAIPSLLASRRAANEGSAQSAMRTVHSAQVTYQATAGMGEYAGDLAALRGEALIDSVLGSGSKSGYEYEIVDQSGSYASAVFGVYGSPAITGGIQQTGTRVFGTTENGIIYGSLDLSAFPASRNDIKAMPVVGN